MIECVYYLCLDLRGLTILSCRREITCLVAEKGSLNTADVAVRRCVAEYRFRW